MQSIFTGYKRFFLFMFMSLSDKSYTRRWSKGKQVCNPKIAISVKKINQIRTQLFWTFLKTIDIG